MDILLSELHDPDWSNAHRMTCKNNRYCLVASITTSASWRTWCKQHCTVH